MKELKYFILIILNFLFLYNIYINFDFIGETDSRDYHNIGIILSKKFGFYIFNPLIVFNFLSNSYVGITSLLYIQYVAILHLLFGSILAPYINIFISILFFSHSVYLFSTKYDYNKKAIFYCFMLLIPVLFNPVFVKTLFSQRKDIYLLSFLIITYFKYISNGNWKVYFIILILFRLQFSFLIPIYLILLFIKNKFNINSIIIFILIISIINFLVFNFTNYLPLNSNPLTSYLKYQNFKPGISKIFIDNQYLRIFYIWSIPWPELSINFKSFFNIFFIFSSLNLLFFFIKNSFAKNFSNHFLFVLSIFILIYFQFSVSVFYNLYFTMEPRYVLPLNFFSILVFINYKQSP